VCLFSFTFTFLELLGVTYWQKTALCGEAHEVKLYGGTISSSLLSIKSDNAQSGLLSRVWGEVEQGQYIRLACRTLIPRNVPASRIDIIEGTKFCVDRQ
jgi:hypothetical protein